MYVELLYYELIYYNELQNRRKNMSLETSKNIIKIFGILGIICGIATLILGIIILLGGGIAAGTTFTSEEIIADVVRTVAVIGAAVIAVSGFVTLLEGFFSVRAVNDNSKLAPARAFAFVGFVAATLGIIANLGVSPLILLGPVCVLIINGVALVALNISMKS